MPGPKMGGRSVHQSYHCNTGRKAGKTFRLLDSLIDKDGLAVFSILISTDERRLGTHGESRPGQGKARWLPLLLLLKTKRFHSAQDDAFIPQKLRDGEERVGAEAEEKV